VYCRERGIPFRSLDCHASNIIEQARDLKAILWHWAHNKPEDLLVARQIVAALELAGVHVYPSTSTCWHYDDKIAQKYLLESISAPLIPTWVFTKQNEAITWIHTASWPKVWKLRSGAGSANVRLVRSKQEAIALCKRAFHRGFVPSPGYLDDLRSRTSRIGNWVSLLAKIRNAPENIGRIVRLRRQLPREKGYIYFQDFMPGNDFDTRITVIGNRAFGFVRLNRHGDFRASGSGSIDHDPNRIDSRCVEISFAVVQKLRCQSLAIDFLSDPAGNPRIGEISYAFMSSAVQHCKGSWSPSLVWTEGRSWPEDEILTGVLESIRSI
jgi:glutathione synthase/RimK-type ligase-like ATP-grasp enzyme